MGNRYCTQLTYMHSFIGFEYNSFLYMFSDVAEIIPHNKVVVGKI